MRGVVRDDPLGRAARWWSICVRAGGRCSGFSGGLMSRPSNTVRSCPLTPDLIGERVAEHAPISVAAPTTAWCSRMPPRPLI